MSAHEVRGFALLCDASGKITNVLRDDFGLANHHALGKMFANLVEVENRRESLNFIVETKQQKISFDHRLNIKIGEKSFSFYFIGIELMNDLLIIGAENHKEAIDFANHLQEINNEQSNLIRHFLKNETSKKQAAQEESRLLFDEITNLNNELVNLQRELTRKNIELERLNELKNRFLGMAAHDLRNPLGVLLNYSDFLIDEAASQLSEEHQKFLHIINNSAEAMLRLVEDLLDYSKIQDGKIELKLSNFDLVNQTRNQVEQLNTLSAKKNIHIAFRSNVHEVFVTGDVFKMDQVIGNLVNNAIKFSNPGSKIRVEISKYDEKVVLSVTDYGKGIQPENLEKIFQPFTKLSTTGTSGEKGTSLGLSIVKRIVEGHGGKIWVESVVEKQTTFYVELPLNNVL